VTFSGSRGVRGAHQPADTAGMKRSPALLLSLGLGLTVTACGGGDSSGAEAASATASAADPTGNIADVTNEVRASASGASWADTVTTATLTEPGRITAETTITDPRGADGSPAAQQAIQVCEGVVAYLQGTGVAEPKVSVMEGDGSTFVLYGHPSYPGGCVEV
jgi:hypothetical protein